MSLQKDSRESLGQWLRPKLCMRSSYQAYSISKGAGEEESDSDSEEEGEEQIPEEASAPGEIILLAIELVKEQQKSDTDCQRLALWVNATATPTRDDLQTSCPYLRVLAQNFDRIAKVDEMLVLREETEGTNQVTGGLTGLPHSLEK